MYNIFIVIFTCDMYRCMLERKGDAIYFFQVLCSTERGVRKITSPKVICHKSLRTCSNQCI